MAATITEIATVRLGSRVRIISLDGEVWHTSAAAVIRTLRLEVGDIVDPERLADDIRDAERAAARERALALLGYRERSVAELRTKVLDDGYPPDVVAELIADLQRSGIVDDARFAEAFVRSLSIGRGLGRRRIERELADKGVPDDVANDALREYCNPDDAAARVHAAARRLARRGDRVDLLAARLVRKGYGPGEAFSAARQTLDQMSIDRDADEGE